jgi:hypothetical protein
MSEAISYPHRDHARKLARLVFARSGITKPPVDVRLIAKNERLDYDEVDFFPDDVDALIIPVKDASLPLSTRTCR